MTQARLTDPETSHEAARSVTDLTVKQAHVLAVLEAWKPWGGLTDERIRLEYVRDDRPYQSESGLRTRRHELVELGLVVDSGRRERLASGRRAIIWEAV